MAKSKTVFFCPECGFESLKWLGRCPGCGSWNSMVEQPDLPVKNSGRAAVFHTGSPVSLADVDCQPEKRLVTAKQELDRVCGGGIVTGSLVLLSGDPGIGKSTLLLQLSEAFAEKHGKVLYVSGEESARQVKLRADRLGINHPEVYLVSESNLDQIETHIDNLKPGLVIIDSIQTVVIPELNSPPGSVLQVRESALRLMGKAKGGNLPIFITGHVTKEGNIAGPRVLEHLVDTVLYLEGDRQYSYRILRSVKNRFGATHEIGVFDMTDEGLKEVRNPSQVFLRERVLSSSGSAVVACIEGSRPLLLEIQALVSPSSFGHPRRMTTGLDYNRTSLLLAVLEKRVRMFLGSQDVYLSVTGGVKIEEPAADLAIAVAVASSLKDIPADPGTVVVGEIGLTGEVRGISYIERRVKEAAKLGFHRVIAPRRSLERLKHTDEIKVIGVDTVTEALTAVLGRGIANERG